MGETDIKRQGERETDIETGVGDRQREALLGERERERKREREREREIETGWDRERYEERQGPG